MSRILVDQKIFDSIIEECSISCLSTMPVVSAPVPKPVTSRDRFKELFSDTIGKPKGNVCSSYYLYSRTKVYIEKYPGKWLLCPKNTLVLPFIAETFCNTDTPLMDFIAFKKVNDRSFTFYTIQFPDCSDKFKYVVCDSQSSLYDFIDMIPEVYHEIC